MGFWKETMALRRELELAVKEKRSFASAVEKAGKAGQKASQSHPAVVIPVIPERMSAADLRALMAQNPDLKIGPGRK